MAKIKVRKKIKQVTVKIPSLNDSIEWHVMARAHNLKKFYPLCIPKRFHFRVKVDEAIHHEQNVNHLFTHEAGIYEKTC